MGISRPEARTVEPAITIFTTAKPFNGLSGVIQRNALHSWASLGSEVELLLIGDEDGYAEAAAEVGAQRIPALERNEFGTPLVSDLFQQGRTHGRGEILVFANADIIVPPNFVQALATVRASFERFLVVGRRIDLDVTEPIDFEDRRWYEHLRARVAREGHLRGNLCIDWFAFDRSTLLGLPAFAIGRTRYDNWILWKAADEGAAVIDASNVVPVVHQNHDYGHTGGSIAAWEGPEARRAAQLIGHWTHYHSIEHASYELVSDGTLRRTSRRRWLQARARRSVGQALRFSRPWRRRLRQFASGRGHSIRPPGR